MTCFRLVPSLLGEKLPNFYVGGFDPLFGSAFSNDLPRLGGAPVRVRGSLVIPPDGMEDLRANGGDYAQLLLVDPGAVDPFGYLKS